MDEQMGMAMAQTYDPSFQGQATPAYICRLPL